MSEDTMALANADAESWNLTSYESNVIIEALSAWCMDGDDILDEKRAAIVNRIYDKLKAIIMEANK